MKIYLVNKKGSREFNKFSSEEDAQKFCRYMKDKQGVEDLQISVKDHIIDDLPKTIPVSDDDKYKVTEMEFFALLNSKIK